MDINDIMNFDVVKDEYGNFYGVSSTNHKLNELKEVTISHIYYYVSAMKLLDSEEIKESQKRQHISEYLRILVNGHIENMERRERRIFSIQELVQHGVKVSFMDITKKHPRSN